MWNIQFDHCSFSVAEMQLQQDENINGIKFSDLAQITQIHRIKNINEFWFLNFKYITYNWRFLNIQ